MSTTRKPSASPQAMQIVPVPTATGSLPPATADAGPQGCAASANRTLPSPALPTSSVT